MTASLLTAVPKLLSDEGSSFIFEVSPAEPLPENELNVKIEKLIHFQTSNTIQTLLTIFLNLHRLRFNGFQQKNRFTRINGQLIDLKMKNLY